MDRRVLVVGIVVAVVLVGVLAFVWWGSGPSPDAPTPEQVARVEVVDEIDRDPSAHEHGGEAEDDEQRGNPDRPVTGPGRDNIENQPPLNDAEAWKARRLEQARVLHEGQVAAVRTYGSSQGLTDDQTQAVVAAVDALHTDLRAIKQRIEDGDAAPSELRESAPGLRERAAASVESAVGPEHTAGLRAWLKKDALGGGF